MEFVTFFKSNIYYIREISDLTMRKVTDSARFVGRRFFGVGKVTTQVRTINPQHLSLPTRICFGVELGK